MTRTELEVISSLKAKGYAVVVWTPVEIGPIPPRHIEAESVKYVWGNIIEPAMEEAADDA